MKGCIEPIIVVYLAKLWIEGPITFPQTFISQTS